MQASELFWQDFIKLVNNSCSYALLKRLILDGQKLAKFGIVGKIFDETKNGIFGGKILWSLIMEFIDFKPYSPMLCATMDRT